VFGVALAFDAEHRAQPLPLGRNRLTAHHHLATRAPGFRRRTRSQGVINLFLLTALGHVYVIHGMSL
jgi:hypothetical protein